MSQETKERPILFSGPMIRALLAGTKTQTRRVVKFRHIKDERFAHIACEGMSESPELAAAGCPYGQPGDRLWVRESTYARPLPNILTGEPTNAICGAYSADDESVLNPDGFDFAWWYSKAACPSIHMPRWASRILLEVTGVRVERLNDISEADAMAEGVSAGDWITRRFQAGPISCDESKNAGSAREAYAALWEQINGSGSWAANPFVWCVEFKRITPCP